MIKSDNFIRQMCERPTFIYHKQNGVSEYISEPLSPHQQRVLAATSARKALMSCTVMDSEARENKDLFEPLIETIEIIPSNAEFEWTPMIEPFSPKSIKIDSRDNRIISAGLSSYGYDVSLAEELKIFTNINSTVVDVYDLRPECYVDAKITIDEKGRKYAILPPNSFMLGHTIEYFKIPNDVMVVCIGKSTWARAGIGLPITPIEPGGSGCCEVTIRNDNALPAKIYVNDVIGTMLFLGIE